MAVLALIAWSVTAIVGLYLLAIWLIEYDPGFQDAAATKLPVPVVCGHVLFAVGGLLSLVIYLITDQRIYCWIAAGAMALIAALGLSMAIRWIGVYRARPGRASAQAVPGRHALGPASPQAWATTQTRASGASRAPGSSGGLAGQGELAVPPERHFPLSGVIAHGFFAIITIVLIVLTVLRAAGK